MKSGITLALILLVLIIALSFAQGLKFNQETPSENDNLKLRILELENRVNLLESRLNSLEQNIEKRKMKIIPIK